MVQFMTTKAYDYAIWQHSPDMEVNPVSRRLEPKWSKELHFNKGVFNTDKPDEIEYLLNNKALGVEYTMVSQKGKEADVQKVEKQAMKKHDVTADMVKGITLN